MRNAPMIVNPVEISVRKYYPGSSSVAENPFTPFLMAGKPDGIS
jgi:hypothetical protein